VIKKCFVPEKAIQSLHLKSNVSVFFDQFSFVNTFGKFGRVFKLRKIIKKYRFSNVLSLESNQT
jgi:hypothetical protein